MNLIVAAMRLFIKVHFIFRKMDKRLIQGYEDTIVNQNVIID